MFRVIVAGSRDFSDYEYLKAAMNHLLKGIEDEVCIVCGKARGADMLGDKYAREYNLKVDYYPADWNKHGKSAGYIRNEIMARNADALVAFWDGQSRGTGHMINLAKKYKLRVCVIKYRTS